MTAAHRLLLFTAILFACLCALCLVPGALRGDEALTDEEASP